MRTLALLFLLSAPAFAQSDANGAAPPAPDATPAPAPETPAPAPETPTPETPSDAPKAEPVQQQPAPSVAPAPAPAPVAAPTENAVSLSNHSTPKWWLQAGAGAVAGLISVPISLYVGGWLGSLTNNVYVGLLLDLLLQAVLPSLAVTAAVVGIGNYYSPGTYPFWRVWGLTALGNIAALIIGIAVRVSTGNIVSMLLYAICDAIVMTGIATPSARWLAMPKNGEPPSNKLASLEPWNPGAAQRWFVPATEVSF